jgi:hypothetical protein
MSALLRTPADKHTSCCGLLCAASADAVQSQLLSPSGCPIYCIDLRSQSWIEDGCICNLDRVKVGVLGRGVHWWVLLPLCSTTPVTGQLRIPCNKPCNKPDLLNSFLSALLLLLSPPLTPYTGRIPSCCQDLQ